MRISSSPRTVRAVAFAIAAIALLGAGGVAIAQTPAASTRQFTLTAGGPFDPAKPGFAGLVTGPGQRQFLREIGSARAQPGRSRRRTSLTYFAQLTDLHLVDEESPARIDSLAPVQPNTSAQRPQEALMAATIDAGMRRLNAFTTASPNAGAKGARAPMDMALLTGDQADNQQENEVTWMRQLLEGGQSLDPNSGISDYSRCTAEQRAGLARLPLDEAGRYTGLQDYGDYNGGAGDGNFYDPNRPAGVYGAFPQYSGLMDSAQRAFVPAGLRRGAVAVPTYVSSGNHDEAVQGYVSATQSADQVATGCFKPYIQSPATNFGANEVLASQSGFAVPPDPRRRFVNSVQNKRIYSSGAQRDAHGFGFVDPAQNAGSGGSASYYAWTPKRGVRFVSLDTASEGTAAKGGAEGNLDEPQYQWLRGELRKAKRAKQVVVVFGHHPIRRLIASIPDEAAGPCNGNVGCDADPRNSSPVHLRGDVERLFNANPNVVAYLSGHTHVNRIRPCATRCVKKGNWWSIETTSSVDWPQQQRLVEVMDNHDGTLSVLGTQVDHAGSVTPPPPSGDPGSTAALGVEALASMSRVFSYNDPRAVRRAGGGNGDRNVELMARDPRAGRGAGICTGVTANVSGRTVNRATLGRTRGSVRRAFTKYSLKGRSSAVDRYCAVGGGYLRVGYSRNRAVLALSSSRSNRLKQLKVGYRQRTVARRLHGERRYRVGKSTIYVAKASRARIVVVVVKGRVTQLGLADKRRTSSRKKTQALLKAFL
ncbi:MAG: metallophosphoesterase family protein [Thermoleophilaceae bacterium]